MDHSHQNGIFLNEDLLWDYADGLLSPDEQRQVEQLLARYPERQAQLAHIRQQKVALSALKPDSPKAGFADKVMAAWVAEQFHEKARSAPDRKLLLFPLVLGGLLVFGLALTVAAVIKTGLPEVQQSPALPALPTVSPDFITATLQHAGVQMGVLMVFALMALVLLERWVRVRRWVKA